jgi:hypothetical protein
MKPIETSISVTQRVISLLLAIYLLNFSIDTRDANPDHIAEDLSFNDIESMYEFFAEEILGIENAVAEHDENDPDDGGSFEFKKWYFLVGSLLSPGAQSQYRVLARGSEILQRISSKLTEIHSPPPQA